MSRRHRHRPAVGQTAAGATAEPVSKPHLSPPLVLALGLLLGTFLLCASCGGDPGRPLRIEDVDHPDLAAAEPAVRDQVGPARAALDALLEQGVGGAPAGELAAAYGALGELYHAYGLLDPARACYRNAARLAPDDSGWRYRLGLAAQQAGDQPAAADAFAAALALDSDDRAARLRLSEVRLELGDPAECRRLLGSLASDSRYGPAARFGLARAALASGDAATAAEHFRAVLDRRPEAVAARHGLATALRRQGRDAEAEALLTEAGGSAATGAATAGEPATAGGASRGDAGGAAGAAGPAGEIDFPDPVAERIAGLAESAGGHLERGNRALVAGRLGEAVGELREAAGVDPESAAARRNLALALRRSGDASGAVRELEEALAAHPDDPLLHFDLGNALLDQGGPGAADRAAAEFRRAVELAPELTRARFNLANVLAGQERWAVAERQLATVLEREPENRRARYLAAMAAFRLGRPAEAATALSALAAEDPADLDAARGLMAVDAAAGRFDALVARLDAVLGLGLPAERAVPVALDAAQAAAQAGRWEVVRRCLEPAVERYPAEAEAAHALARLLATSPDPTVRDGRRAVELARRAHAAHPSLEHALTVGMALAESGDYPAAVAWQSALVEQAEAQRLPPAVRAQLARTLESYRAGRPVRLGSRD